MMGDHESGFTENQFFKRSEFACRCGCGYDTVDARLLEMLTIIRASYNAPLIIHSGARCEHWNKRQGGSGSQHLWGKAADFHIEGVEPKEVYDLLDQTRVNWAGLGLYRSWVHLDIREEKARWSNV